jgi:hypothetical protein
VKDFSIIEQQITERDKLLIQEAAFGRGLKSLPPDWEKNKSKRIKKGSKDFFYAAKEYFPQWFDYPFCDEHHQLIDAAMSNDRLIHLFGAPRGFGKTRLFRVFKVFSACFGWKHHYSKASDTIDLVEKDFRWVRLILKYNPKIVADFGSIVDDSWDSLHSFRIVPHKHNELGTIFVANSYTVTPRGELGDTRLDFEEFDDFEDFRTSINPDISLSKIDTIERDFQPALTEDGCGVYLGNNARTTCIINVLQEMKPADRKANHPALEVTIIDGWNEKKSRPTWHQRYQAKTEDEFRASLAMSVSVFNAEVRQKPSPPEGTRFLLKDWRTYKSFPKDAVGVMFCDPAFGQKSDFKAIAPVFYSYSMRQFLVPESFVRRCGWEEYFLAMYSFHERYRNQLLYIAWESNFAQAQYLEFRKIYVSTQNKPDLPIRFIQVEGDKFFRIEQLETPYSIGNILFAEDFLASRDGIEAQSQMIGYEGKKDANHRVDFPDALSSAYKLVWPIAMRGGDSDSPEIEIGGPRRGK